MAALFPWPKVQFTDSNGDPLSSGKVYTYEAGTSTPLATYTDSGGGTPNANPVILDSRGEANIWFDASKLYKLVLKTSADVTVWTVDNVGLTADSISFIASGSSAVRRTMQDKERDIVSLRDFCATVDGSTDNTTGITAAIAALPSTGGAVYAPSRSTTDKYVVSNLTVTKPLKVYGDGTENTRFLAKTAATGYMWTLQYSSGGNESHLQGIEFHDLSLEGNNRGADIGAIYVDRVDRFNTFNVCVTGFQREAINFYRSVRESWHHGLLARLNGTGTTYPQINLYDNGTGTDGHNNIWFIAPNIAFPMGTNVQIGAGNANSMPRLIHFIGGILHNWVSTGIDAATYTYNGTTVSLTYNDGRHRQIVVKPCNGLFLQDMRLEGSGRGMPLVDMPLSTIGSVTNNAVHISNCDIGDAGPDTASLSISTTTDNTTDLFTASAHGLGTGDLVRLTALATTTGVVLNQNYYVIEASSSTFSVAKTLALANSGIAIDLLTGAGTATVEPLEKHITYTVDDTTDVFTATNHGLETEAVVRFSTTDTLPTGLNNTADWYAIRVTADTFKIASTRTLARAGTATDITGTGVGTQYVKPQRMACYVEEGQLTINGGQFSGVQSQAYIHWSNDANSIVRVSPGTLLREITRIVATPMLGQKWQTRAIVKATREDVASSTAFQNDDELIMALDANGKYQIGGKVWYATLAAADFKCFLTPPGNVARVFRYGMRGLPTGASAVTDDVSNGGAYSGISAAGQTAASFGGVSTTGAGVAQAGSTTTLTFNAGDSATADVFVPDHLYATGGTGSGQHADIDDYTTGRVATFVDPVSVAFDGTTTYDVLKVLALDIEGYLECAASGNLIFKWAQNSSQTTPTSVMPGSTLEVTRMI